MKFNVSASSDILKEYSAYQINYLLRHYGLNYFRRRGLLLVNGRHIIIGTPDEVERLKFAERRVIGWVEL